jgi:dolichyl-phosphate-mannose-protein mannosyltransferase
LSDNGAGEMTNRRYLAFLFVIVLVGILMRVFHFHLTIGVDDQRWIIAAGEFGSDQPHLLRPVYYSRIVWRAVLAAWGAPWGLSLGTSAVLMFSLSCLSISLVAQGARVAFGPLAGLFAAAIYATHPLLIVYDVATLPDGLALALMATYLFLFLKYQQTSRTVYLISSAVVIGLSFSVKEYYVLAAVPLGACLLFKQYARNGRWRDACLFSAGVLAGLSVDSLLHFWESGTLLAHFTAISGYGGHPVAASGGGEHLPYTGWERFARFLFTRLVYFRWLFLDFGIASGFLLLWGSVFFVLKARTHWAYRMLLGVLLILFAFLFAAPSAFHPLRFVEVQPYYLTVLLPALAIGSGGALSAAFTSLRPTALQKSLLVAVTIGLASNLLIPNDFTNASVRRSFTSEFVGIQRILVDAEARGIEELILPKVEYQTRLPDRYYAYRAKLTLRDVAESDSARATIEYLRADHGRALFLPRHEIRRSLMLDLRRGEYTPSSEHFPSHVLLGSLLTENGCSVQQVRVPDTAVKSWLARLGLIRFEQDLVGWVYQFDNSPQK